jgi:molybdopterin-containing oxidoreductase family membrane subunit
LIAVTIVTYRVKNEEIFPGLKAIIFEMAQVLALILAVGFLLIIFRLTSGLLDPTSRGPVMLLINGPFSIGFWGFEVGLMSVLPIYVFIWAAEKKSLSGVLAGSIMVLIGTFIMRYNFVVAGQVYPNIPLGLPSYLPTLMEVFVISGVIASFLLVYILGDMFLSLKEDKSHHVT